jgi:hypothetical protein
MPDRNPIDISSRHRTIPHARIIADRHMSKYHRAFGDEHTFPEGGFLSKKSHELFFQFIHKFAVYSKRQIGNSFKGL